MRLVATTYGTLRDSREDAANAHRIVQCVNACEGISDPRAALDLAADAILLLEEVATHLVGGYHFHSHCDLAQRVKAFFPALGG